MIRVLYDISAIGAAKNNLRMRTGIYRVTETVGLKLLDSPEVALSLSAFHSRHYLAAAHEYARVHPRFRRVPFNACRDQQIAERLRPIVKYEVDGEKYPRPARWLQYHALRYVKKLEANDALLDVEDLSKKQILHSTFCPLPEYTATDPRVRAVTRFLTVYDLIPILYPQYFECGPDHILYGVMNSIRPDDWVLAISEATKNDLCNHVKISPERVFVTPLAASEQFYPCTDASRLAAVRAKYKIPDAPYILSLCTLEPRKNLDHLIRSFRTLVLQEKIRDLNLVLVGTLGWHYDKILEEASGMEALKDRIIMTGYVDDEDQAALYSGARAFCYPSRYEGFGLPPLEAMQCGTPAITSNSSSLPEVVGDAGIMLDPDDGDGLCAALLRLYRDASYREELGAKGLERSRQFSWDRCTRQTIDAYKIALGK